MNCDVLFRVDADAKIGIGHLRRCQALIEGFEKAGLKRFAFVTRTPKAFKEWLGGRYPVFTLKAASFNDEISELKKLFSSGNARFTLIDRYGISTAYLAALNRFVPVLLSLNDDVQLKDYPVDGIINYNIYAERLKYPSSTDARLFLGPRFTPIRQEFIKARGIKKKQGLKRIFVTLGGYAKAQHLEKIRGALELTGLPLEVSWASGRTRNVAAKMAGADLAVSAGGVTTYELACLGVPSLLVVLAENQRIVAQEWAKRGVALNLGSFQSVSQKKLTGIITRLLNSKKNLKSMHRNAIALVDGKGSERLAKAVIKIFGE